MTKRYNIQNYLTKKTFLLIVAIVVLVSVFISIFHTSEYVCSRDVICNFSMKKGEIQVRFKKNGEPASGKILGMNPKGEKMEVYAKKGIFYGKLKIYGKNGILKIDSELKDNVGHGKYKEYYDNGKIKEETFFKEGKVQDKKTYYQNGQLNMDLHYTESKLRPGNDVLTGWNRTYYENGQLAQEAYWENEKAIKTKMYDEEGKETSECEQELAELEEWFSNMKTNKCVKRTMEDSYNTSNYGEVMKACARAEAEAAVVYYNKKRIIQKKCTTMQ